MATPGPTSSRCFLNETKGSYDQMVEVHARHAWLEMDWPAAITDENPNLGRF